MNTDYKAYRNTEAQVFTIAKQIPDNSVVIVGTGLPILGAVLAKRCFLSECQLVVESGLMDFMPHETPRSVNDLRSMAHCAAPLPPFRYLGFQMNELLWDRDRTIGFIGGAAVDIYGNVASTSVGDYKHPKMRLPGSGGANGIASFCNTIIVMPHKKRHFPAKLDYNTSPGWLTGPGSRAKAGLPENRGPMAVVTDLGLLKFDEETRKMYLAGYYPSTSPEEVQANTGFELDVSRAAPLEAPPEDIVKLIRTELDPEDIFLYD